MSLLQDEETEHGPVVEDFVQWCVNMNLKLNITKTKDMKTEFRKVLRSLSPVLINSAAIEFVENY